MGTCIPKQTGHSCKSTPPPWPASAGNPRQQTQGCFWPCARCLCQTSPGSFQLWLCRLWEEEGPDVNTEVPRQYRRKGCEPPSPLRMGRLGEALRQQGAGLQPS